VRLDEEENMRKMIITALSVAALAISGAAMAHDDEADATVDLSAAGGPILYVDAETQGLWEESNDDPGLQTQPHTHTVDGEQVVIPADTLHGQLPTAPELPAPPDLP
jgi:hypothetical protein